MAEQILTLEGLPQVQNEFVAYATKTVENAAIMNSLKYRWFSLPEFDLAAISQEPPEVAVQKFTEILRRLDKVEKQVFAIRGDIARAIEEGQLYRSVLDPDVGEYYRSFDKFLRDTCPDTWRDVRKALAAVKDLRDIPVSDLAEMKRCNVEQLRRTSSNVRTQPEVIQAAKTLPERELVEKLNQRFDQHLECNRPIVMAPAGDVAEFEAAIQLAMELEECRTRQEAIKCISVDYLESHRIELEYRKPEFSAPWDRTPPTDAEFLAFVQERWPGDVWIGKTGTVRLTGEALACLRKHVYERDGRACQLCARILHFNPEWSGDPAACDMAHRKSRGAGGSDLPSNTMALCHRCHGMAHRGQRIL